MMSRLLTFRVTLLPVLVFVASCGGSEGGAVTSTPYDPGTGTVIGGADGTAMIASTKQCNDASCQAIVDQCGKSGAGDVILDASGGVVEVICYKQGVDVSTVPTDTARTANIGNNAVLVLDGADDGVDVTGNVQIDGNNSVVWGSGPDTSVIGGTLEVHKNNAVVRGVRIQSDVTIVKNDLKLVFCVIEGDLTITGNNATVAGCDVFGKVTLTGLNTTLVANRFNGVDTVAGYNLTCNDNLRFDEQNGDFVVDDPEIGGAVTCVEADGPPDPQSDPTTADGGVLADATL